MKGLNSTFLIWNRWVTLSFIPMMVTHSFSLAWSLPFTPCRSTSPLSAPSSSSILTCARVVLHLQGGFFNWSAQKMTKCQITCKSLQKSSKCQNFLRVWDLVIFRADQLKKPPCIYSFSHLDYTKMKYAIVLNHTYMAEAKDVIMGTLQKGLICEVPKITSFAFPIPCFNCLLSLTGPAHTVTSYSNGTEEKK